MSLDTTICSTFTFSLDSFDYATYSKTFYSSEGEEYILNVHTTRYDINTYTPYNSYEIRNSSNIDVNFTIKWRQKSSKCVTIKGYDAEKQTTLFTKMLFAKSDGLCINSTITIQKRKTMFVIDISPYVCLSKCRPGVTLSKDQQAVKKSFVEKRTDQLSVDIGSLLKTGTLSDVVLTDGESEIHAHKVILSSRSPVFAKMFVHPTKENRENLIMIKDLPITVQRALLDYFYTGTAAINDRKMARDLYVAADKYDVKSLKDICTKLLISVDLENVLDTLLLADLYNDKKIKEAALRFITSNYSEVKALEEWNNFKSKNQSLAIEVLSFVLEHKN